MGRWLLAVSTWGLDRPVGTCASLSLPLLPAPTGLLPGLPAGSCSRLAECWAGTGADCVMGSYRKPRLEGLQEDGAMGVVREPEGTSEKAVASWCGC